MLWKMGFNVIYRVHYDKEPYEPDCQMEVDDEFIINGACNATSRKKGGLTQIKNQHEI